MEKLTVKEAIEQGYTHCGYDTGEWQHVRDITKLDPDDFSNEYRRLVLCDPRPSYTGISADDIREVLAERVQNIRQDETADDTDNCSDAVNEMELTPFRVLADAINEKLKSEPYYTLTDIELTP